MKKSKYLTGICFICLLCTIKITADSYQWFHDSSRLFDDAYFEFDNGNYGIALRLAEEAKNTRNNEVNAALNMIGDAMRPLAVQNAGDSINEVIAVLKQRDVYEVVEMINYLVTLKGEDYFDDSIAAVNSYLMQRKVFPECEYLIARIYEFEGEYSLAYSYYLDAWNHAFALDIPSTKYDILYDMANLSYNFSDLDNCEKALLLIVADDPFFSDAAYSAALLNSVKKGYSADKIFSLYRTNCYRSIPAFFRLAELYSNQGRYEDAFSVALFGVLTSFTRMYEIVQNRMSEYTYTDLNAFCRRAVSYTDICDWSIDIRLWNGLYQLAKLSETLYPAETIFSDGIYTVIVDSAPENYWKQRALSEIYN